MERKLGGFRHCRVPEDDPGKWENIPIRVQSIKFVDTDAGTYFETLKPGCFRNILSISTTCSTNDFPELTITSDSYVENGRWYGYRRYKFIYPDVAAMEADRRHIWKLRGFKPRKNDLHD